MDVLSHGLWGGVAFGRRRKKSFALSVLFGVAPDLIPFGPLFVAQIFNPALRVRPDYASGHPDLSLLPTYVTDVYNYTHSLIIFVLVFGIVWAIKRKPVTEMLAWGLHIMFDIPVHSFAFFPTPFLWPLTDFKINGVPWGRPLIFISNWIALITCYVWWLIDYKRKKKI